MVCGRKGAHLLAVSGQIIRDDVEEIVYLFLFFKEILFTFMFLCCYEETRNWEKGTQLLKCNTKILLK